MHISQVLDAIKTKVFLRSMKEYSGCLKSDEQMKTMRGHQMENNSSFPAVINFAFISVTFSIRSNVR